jgi:hypothetical protein
MKHRSVFLPLLCLLCISCARPSNSPIGKSKKIERACYFWKSAFKLSSVERAMLQKTRCEKLYVKYFDVAWDERQNTTIPVAVLRWVDSIPGGIAVVPTIFLTEESLNRTPEDQIKMLAGNCLDEMLRVQPAAQAFHELQIDCDWTERTTRKYFLFLQSLRSRLPKDVILSATIRLHQVKYREKTGVPPVDRGMLMYYNMTDWRDIKTKNSIFDAEAANRYIDYVHDYPLPLDLALPIFHWSIVYRNNRFLAIKNNIAQADLRKQIAMHEVSDSKFAVDRDTLAFGLPLMKGDIFRAEAVPAHAVTSASDAVLRRIAAPSLTVALFSLDSSSLVRYENSTFDSVWTFRP